MRQHTRRRVPSRVAQAEPPPAKKASRGGEAVKAFSMGAVEGLPAQEGVKPSAPTVWVESWDPRRGDDA